MTLMESIFGDSENNDMNQNQDQGSQQQNSAGGTSMTDKDIANDMISASKSGIDQLSKAITETSNPQLRLILSNQLTGAINSHFRLTDMAEKKGWYDSKSCPKEMVNQDIGEFQGLKSQNGMQ